MSSPIVTIHEGKIQGCIGTDLDGDKFFCFFGIPYAKPPLGELRFKAPQPIEPWTGVKDATQVGSWCIQREMIFTKTFQGTEDCLHLNVFTKTLPEQDPKLKPVMVWIHGGGFTQGSNDTNMYGPEFLMTEDIVLVSINYRLGLLGFLSLEDTTLEVPGNAGLKDQVLALKWVQRNIKHFNGDSNNVTIFGESAGSASVHYLIMSPTAKGLFHKAIMQSGALLNPWPYSKGKVLDFIEFMGKEAKNERQMLEILREMPAEELFLTHEKYMRTKPSLRVVGPVIEKPNPTAFITKHPIKLITSPNYNQVPIMLGYNSNEGLLYLAKSMMKDPPPSQDEKPNLEDFIPPEMEVARGSSISQLICRKLAECYFQGENAKNQFLLETDYYFAMGIIGSAINHAKTSQHPVYLYRMTVESELNLSKKLFKMVDLPGVCHGDDLGYLFKNCILSNMKIGELENVYLRRFLKLWTSFAKHGNPTPNESDLNVEWKPLEGENVHILDIGRELIMHVDPESERVKLWREILQLSPATANYL